jgi:hypothetical protein
VVRRIRPSGLSPPFLARGFIDGKRARKTGMLQSQGRTRPKSPAERAEEYAAVQRQLKEDAAARRAQSTGKRAVGMSRHSRPNKQRRTP